MDLTYVGTRSMIAEEDPPCRVPSSRSTVVQCPPFGPHGPSDGSQYVFNNEVYGGRAPVFKNLTSFL